MHTTPGGGILTIHSIRTCVMPPGHPICVSVMILLFYASREISKNAQERLLGCVCFSMQNGVALATILHDRHFIFIKTQIAYDPN